MATREEKLAAKRFNKFIDRVSATFSTVGMAIAAACVASILDTPGQVGAWIWGGVGVTLVVSSMACLT